MCVDGFVLVVLHWTTWCGRLAGIMADLGNGSRTATTLLGGVLLVPWLPVVGTVKVAEAAGAGAVDLVGLVGHANAHHDSYVAWRALVPSWLRRRGGHVRVLADGQRVRLSKAYRHQTRLRVIGTAKVTTDDKMRPRTLMEDSHGRRWAISHEDSTVWLLFTHNARQVVSEAEWHHTQHAP